MRGATVPTSRFRAAGSQVCMAASPGTRFRNQHTATPASHQCPSSVLSRSRGQTKRPDNEIGTRPFSARDDRIGRDPRPRSGQVLKGRTTHHSSLRNPVYRGEEAPPLPAPPRSPRPDFVGPRDDRGRQPDCRGLLAMTGEDGDEGEGGDKPRPTFIRVEEGSLGVWGWSPRRG